MSNGDAFLLLLIFVFAIGLPVSVALYFKRLVGDVIVQVKRLSQGLAASSANNAGMNIEEAELHVQSMLYSRVMIVVVVCIVFYLILMSFFVIAHIRSAKSPVSFVAQATQFLSFIAVVVLGKLIFGKHKEMAERSLNFSKEYEFSETENKRKNLERLHDQDVEKTKIRNDHEMKVLSEQYALIKNLCETQKNLTPAAIKKVFEEVLGKRAPLETLQCPVNDDAKNGPVERDG